MRQGGRWASVVVLLVGSAVCSAQPALWGELEPGAHAVGFRSFWSVDPGRSYARPRSGIDEGAKRPRPVLVNVWYPAQPSDREPMAHGGYLEIAAEGEWYAGLAGELRTYAREIVSEQLAGGDADALLEALTGAVRGAAAGVGPFPLVLYHAGYGSSFEDNSVLCEYLASHGYIVASSAFLDGTGESLNIDAGADSEADLRHLVRAAGGALPVDWERVGLIGHSGGAHTSIRFICRPSSPVDAAVLLDTTQDYHSFADRRWDDFVPLALESADDIDIPLLFAARQHALFRLADRLSAAERVYLTFRTLHHDAFISQGVIAEEQAGDDQAGAMREEYTELCRGVLLFLNATLGGDEEAQAELEARWVGSVPGESPVVLELVASGESVPEYDESSGVPPTPRELAALIDSGQADLAGQLLRQFAGHPRAAPYREPELAISVMVQLVLEDRTEEARRLLAAVPTDPAEVLRLIGSFESFYRGVGAGETAAQFAAARRALDDEED